MPKKTNNYLLAQELGQQLLKNHWQCTVAESCTGGGLAAAITDCPGSSAWFERGFVSYSNDAKIAMLTVSPQTLQQYGAVSEACVQAMADGALNASLAQVSSAISGIAGPGGGTPTKPVGTVWIAWASHSQPTLTQHFAFEGDRKSIREQAITEALLGLIKMAKKQ